MLEGSWLLAMIKLQSFKIISIKKSALGEFCHYLFWNVNTFYFIDFGVLKMGFLVFLLGVSRKGCIWTFHSLHRRTVIQEDGRTDVFFDKLLRSFRRFQGPLNSEVIIFLFIHQTWFVDTLTQNTVTKSIFFVRILSEEVCTAINLTKAILYLLEGKFNFCQQLQH